MSRRHKPSLVALAAAVLGICASCGTEPETLSAVPRADRAKAEGLRLEQVPSLHAVFAHSQRARKVDSRYHLVDRNGALWAEQSGQGFLARFDTEGVSVAAGGERLLFAPANIDCGGATANRQAIPARQSAHARHRAEYVRDDMLEWYENGPAGLEQGFSIFKRPACAAAGAVRLTIALLGTLKARQSGAEVEFAGPDGKTVLRYGELRAEDATGRELPAWMQVSKSGTELEVSIDDTGAHYPIEVDPLVYIQAAKLLPLDLRNDIYAGFAVAISADGNTAFIGAPLSTEFSTASSEIGFQNAGTAYVFVRSGVGWIQQAKLVPSLILSTGRNFGYSIALSADGNTAIIGAIREDLGGIGGFSAIDAGAAFIYVRSGTTWSSQRSFTGTINNDYLGSSVAISADGNTALVGAPSRDSGSAVNVGSAYVYVRSGTTWTQERQIFASDLATNDNFGTSVALSSDGNTALIGAFGEDTAPTTDNGAAYVFVRSGTTWTQQKKLLASDKESFEAFGNAVALSSDGNTALVGANAESSGGANGSTNGAAYVFVRSGTTWTQQKKLLASDQASSDSFGYSVALSSDGNTALIGANGKSGDGLAYSGAAYIFSRSGTTWSQQHKLLATDRAATDYFGQSVALSGAGDTAVIGAPQDDSAGYHDNGAAYVFALTSTKPDGSSCTTGLECDSTFCADGFCCNSACGADAVDDCQTCSQAKGAPADGICGPVFAGTLCRQAAGDCDTAELCDGNSSACPTDVYLAAGQTCRMAMDACDAEEVCSGSSPVCPADIFRATGQICRPAVNSCDIPEVCSGDGPSCPADRRNTTEPMCSAAPSAAEGGCRYVAATQQSRSGARSGQAILALGLLLAVMGYRRRRYAAKVHP